MSNELGEEELGSARTLLSPEDYQAIGVAMTAISRLEYYVGLVALTSDIGVEASINEKDHEKIFIAMATSSFKVRARKVVEYVSAQTYSKEAKLESL